MYTEIEAGQTRALLLKPWQRPVGRALYVGVSGGIGSGKSTVSEVWRQEGADVVSADEIARDVVAAGSEGLLEIVERFGPAVLSEDGTLNRKKMADIVFASAARRQELENITHPLIANAVSSARAKALPGKVFVYDVPLLVENDMAADFDCVVMVDAPVEARLLRLEQRGLAGEAARKRIRAQAGSDERKRVANIWIDNTGRHWELSEVASRVFHEWLSPKEREM